MHSSFYHMNDISVYLGRQKGRGVTNRKNQLEVLFYVPLPIQSKEHMRKMHSFDQGPVFENTVPIFKMMHRLRKPFQPLHHDCVTNIALKCIKQSFGRLKQLQNTISPETNQIQKRMCALMMAFGRSWYFRNRHLLCEKSLSICGEILHKKLLCTS